jgi:hypothetical protein
MGKSIPINFMIQAHLGAARILLTKLEGLQARVGCVQTMEDVRDILAFEVAVAKETLKSLLEQHAA